MSWNVLPLQIKTLEAETVNKVYENIVYIAIEAIGKGMATIDLLNNMTEVEAEMSTPIALIGSILQSVEDDLSLLNEVSESVYYDGLVTITRYFRLEDYQRWILILNDLYDIIVEGKGEWAQAYSLTEEDEPDFQIDGADVYIRSGTNG